MCVSDGDSSGTVRFFGGIEIKKVQGFKHLGVNSPEQQGGWIRGEGVHSSGSERCSVTCDVR